MGVQTLGNAALDAVEGTAADEEDVLRIDLDELLFGVLTSAVGRHVDHRAFEQFEQALLHTFAAHVARDAGIVALAGNLVDFVDEDDALLGTLGVVVALLEQSAEQAFDVFAHIAGFGEHGGIDDGEGDDEHLRNGLGQQSLARTGAAHHDDVRLLQFHLFLTRLLHLLQTFVVVIDGDRERLLGFVLTDDILVEVGLDFGRFRQFLQVESCW